MSEIEVYKAAPDTGLKRCWYARIDGKILCKSNGDISRFKDAMAARNGANREIERLKRLAVTMASRMPEASDSALNRGVKP